jgi:hypothetical protein
MLKCPCLCLIGLLTIKACTSALMETSSWAVQTMVSHAENIGISIALQILCYQQSTWPLWGMVVFSQLKVNGLDEEHCAFCGSSIHVPIVA